MNLQLLNIRSPSALNTQREYIMNTHSVTIIHYSTGIYSEKDIVTGIVTLSYIQ